MIRVLLADDQPEVRAALRVLLERADDLAVVGEAGDGEHAVALAATLRPDVVLMDVRMPGLDGIAATDRITTAPAAPLAGPGPGARPPVRVVVLTAFALDEYVFAALRAGASGFLVKNTPTDDLHRAIRLVADGQALLDPTVTRRVIEQFTRRSPGSSSSTSGFDLLTDRELEVVRHIATGLTNDEIAEVLHLSIWTVKTHVGAILRKLDARDRTQIVIAAYEHGAVPPRPDDRTPGRSP